MTQKRTANRTSMKKTPAKRKSSTRSKSVKSNKKTVSIKKISPITFEIIGLILIALGVIMLFDLGVVGNWLQAFAKLCIGNWYLVLPFILFAYAVYTMIVRSLPEFKNRFLWGVLFILGACTLFSHITLFKELYPNDTIQNATVLKDSWGVLLSNQGIFQSSETVGGGVFGTILFSITFHLLDIAGSYITATLFACIGFILLTGRALIPYIMAQLPNWKAAIASRRAEVAEGRKYRQAIKQQAQQKAATSNLKLVTPIDEKQEQPKRKEKVVQAIEEIVEEQPIEKKPEPKISAFTQNIVPPPSEQQLVEEELPLEEGELNTLQVNLEEVVEEQPYTLPAMNILQMPQPTDQSGELAKIQDNAATLEQTFQSFGVKASVTEVHLGPAVTEYEVLPDRGVKVSKIVSLQDDIALALAAKDIRIEAPIPGKSAVGIEVPNKEVAMVSLREVLESKENNQPDAKLLIGLGRDISGEAKLAQLNKMPHLLVAGSTGSGKSVCINGIIVSILMRAKPHEVKLMMIDPKMVELNVYNGIPHLLAPVVTDARKASQALKKVVSEMERRYDLFSHTGTRNIESYNNHVDRFNEENDEKHPRMPFIVVIVDELADLMMVASSDVEDSIMRLAQMARAAGIHLIIATQRPSVDVITGIIKANIPSRIAFAVSSAIDSRTILDMSGAEKLLGRGDMLFLPAGQSKPVRVQGAFLSDEEVQNVVDYVISQQKAQYQEEMIPSEEDGNVDLDDTDELYSEAISLIVEQDTASVSFLQRKLKIGYARAARIMDQMEERGVVGPAENSKPRQVLVGK